MTKANDEQKIRAFETDILDEYHKGLNFYNYSSDIVIPYLLQIYGDTNRHRENLIKAGHSETALDINLSNKIHGLGHCIRWILKKQERSITNISNRSADQIHEMAAIFLEWGTTYHMISQEFISWSRGIKDVELLEREKTITFHNPKGYDYLKVLQLQQLYRERMQATYEKYPHSTMDEEFSVWLKDIDLSNPPIANNINWQRVKHSQSFTKIYPIFCEIIFPELAEDTDFEGYNLQSLRRFYALMFIQFHFITWVESVIDENFGVNHSFGSNPLYLNFRGFVRLASIITDLSENVVANIITDLTFNPENFHTSPSIQPFIQGADGTYYILPNLFSILEPSRMILGALNKGPRRKIYDTLINQIEWTNLNNMSQAIESMKQWKLCREKTIRHEGVQINPDLILIDLNRKMLLVIDYKHFIGPISVSEVDYKMKELGKGIHQVENYVSILKRVTKIERLDITGFDIVGALVTHKPLPIPHVDNINVTITDQISFIKALKGILNTKSSLKNLAELTQKTLAHRNEHNLNEEHVFATVRVKDWRIRREGLKL